MRLQFVIVPVPVEELDDFLVYFLSDVPHQIAEDDLACFTDTLVLTAGQPLFKGSYVIEQHRAMQA